GAGVSDGGSVGGGAFRIAQQAFRRPSDRTTDAMAEDARQPEHGDDTETQAQARPEAASADGRFGGGAGAGEVFAQQFDFIAQSVLQELPARAPAGFVRNGWLGAVERGLRMAL